MGLQSIEGMGTGFKFTLFTFPKDNDQNREMYSPCFLEVMKISISKFANMKTDIKHSQEDETMCQVEEEQNECSSRDNENDSVALSQTVKQEMGTDHEYSVKPGNTANNYKSPKKTRRCLNDSKRSKVNIEQLERRWDFM